MGKFFSAPSAPPPPPPPPPVPTREDPQTAVEIDAAREKLRLAEKQRKGRAASILTSGRGVTDELGTIARPVAQSGARASQLLGQ